jgi:GNAT superfamily N-acetyltransferase
VHPEHGRDDLCVLKWHALREPGDCPIIAYHIIPGKISRVHEETMVDDGKQKDGMIIREAKANDLDPVMLLYSHLFDNDEKAEEEALEKAWQDILNDPRMHFFILENYATPVSMCVLSIIPNLTRGARPYGLIENVVTRRECRNQGYGTELLGHALSVAWKSGCYKVMLLTGRTDPAVFRLYEKAMFKRGVKEGLIAYPPLPGTESRMVEFQSEDQP